MRAHLTYIFFIFLSIIVVSGCDTNPTRPKSQRKVAVYGFLWGDEYVTKKHGIYISYTKPILEKYDINKAGIPNATVTLTDSSSGTTTQLKHNPDRPGFYYDDQFYIKPNTTYLLQINVDGKVLTASTHVPPVLEMQTELRSDTVNVITRTNIGYKKPIWINTSRDDQIILVDMYCNESWENAEYIYPFGNQKHPRNREEYDQGQNGEPRYIHALVAYRDMFSSEFGNLPVIYWYHSMIVFYGSNTMQVLAIDENYHRYFYTEHPPLEGGIHGGVGLFGSVYGKVFELHVVKE